jgi:Family of unknown function (DUF5694)
VICVTKYQGVRLFNKKIMKYFLTIILIITGFAGNAQTRPVEVLTLGTFHFSFPNLDVKKIDREDQIDVLEPKYQKEIQDIVRRISQFRPTVIVIERQPSEQLKTDSLYNLYLAGKYPLKRNEEEQIGFRIAKQLGLNKLYCVDEWGNFNPRINDIVYGKDSIEALKFENYFEHNPDSAIQFHPKPQLKTKGILYELRKLNNEINIKKDLGNYLTGLFKYESEKNDFTGVDFETGRWFSRNLKIFRNIQRIPVKSSDRILVIFGADHLNLLNYFFECSPEYKLIKASQYLQ